MKKSLLLILFLLPSLLFAQDSLYDSCYKKYTGRQGFTTVEITSDMIRMIGNSTAKNSLDGIKTIRIIVSESRSQEFTDDIASVAAKGKYSLMTSVNENGRSIRFYFRDMSRQSKPSEFLMTLSGDRDNLSVYIMGDIDLRKISDISGMVSIDRQVEKAMDNLERDMEQFDEEMQQLDNEIRNIDK